MLLGARPLTTAADDQQLYVRRPVDDRLDEAVAGQLNVLLRSRRGAGVTSLLNRLEGTAGDVVSVNAADAHSPGQLLQAVVARARVPRQVLSQFTEAFSRADPLEAPAALRELRSALNDQDRHVTMLVDGPVDPSVAHDLFGRLRDEVFGVPASWVVAAHGERAGEYLTPPADVFFETVHQIEDLSTRDARELLTRRGVVEQMSPSVLQAILDAQDGTPRSVITLARGHLQRDPHDAEATMRAYAQATSALPRGAATLLAELQGRGPVTATDPDLLVRLGVTDRQLRRYLSQLDAAGLVETVPTGRPGPGRPATTYMLTDLGSAAGVNPT